MTTLQAGVDALQDGMGTRVMYECDGLVVNGTALMVSNPMTHLQ